MAVYGVTIQNTGSAATLNPIWIKARSIDPLSFGRHNFVEKANADTLQRADTAGRKIPSFSVVGVLDWRNTSSAVINGLTCSAATMENLLAYVNLTQSVNSQIVMKASWGKPGEQRWLRNFDNNTNGFNIAIDALTWHLKSDTEGNHIWDYDMDCRQVAPEE